MPERNGQLAFLLGRTIIGASGLAVSFDDDHVVQADEITVTLDDGTVLGFGAVLNTLEMTVVIPEGETSG